MTPSQSHQQITVEEYYTRAQIGLIDPDARVELIEGEVIDMAPIGNRHGYAVDLLNARLCALADDALLVIEVSDATLRKDMEVKTPLYARHGVPEVWIVDLQQNRIRYLRAPQGGRYRDVSSATEPGSTPVPGLAGAEIALAALFDR